MKVNRVNRVEGSLPIESLVNSIEAAERVTKATDKLRKVDSSRSFFEPQLKWLRRYIKPKYRDNSVLISNERDNIQLKNDGM